MSSLLVGVLSSLAPTIAVIVNVILSHRTKRVADGNATSLADIHVLVNGRLGQALDRISGLERALGIEANDPIPHRHDHDAL